LVTDVGETLACWLQRRPATASRRVFVTTKAPIVDIRAALVSETLRRICLRCGVEVVGAHRLRHGLAADMLQRGASLVEVGQVLRHRDLATTAVYAKVDIENLRRMAQLWPGVSA
jgi:integrase/recombinase XerD